MSAERWRRAETHMGEMMAVAWVFIAAAWVLNFLGSDQWAWRHSIPVFAPLFGAMGLWIWHYMRWHYPPPPLPPSLEERCHDADAAGACEFDDDGAGGCRECEG